jgi:hypothetical protein
MLALQQAKAKRVKPRDLLRADIRKVFLALHSLRNPASVHRTWKLSALRSA